MELERLLPLLIIWIIWRILTNRRKAAKVQAGVPPVFSKKEPETGEPVPAVATPPSPAVSKTEAEEQPFVIKTVMPPPVIPRRRARHRIMGLDGSFLQQVVAWAEILAPPVSLRDSRRPDQCMSLLDKNARED